MGRLADQLDEQDFCPEKNWLRNQSTETSNVPTT